MNDTNGTNEIGLRIVKRLRKFLNASRTVEKFRTDPSAFSRERLLTFPMAPRRATFVVITILKGHKVSLQTGLNKVFKTLDRIFEVPSASALSQARKKLKPEIFISGPLRGHEMNRLVCEEYYKANNQTNSINPGKSGKSTKAEKLWNGHRVLGFDGTYVNLPNYKAIREAYSIQTNQRGSCVQWPLGRATCTSWRVV